MPVLDRRRPGFRHLRHHRFLAFRKHDRRGRSLRATICLIAHIPGNILAGNWRAAVYLDEKVSPQQEEAILGVFTGKLGGPVADLAKLVGEVVSVEKVPIQFDVQGAKGTLKVGTAGYAELEPYQGPSGKPTTLQDTVFSTVPGAPGVCREEPPLSREVEKTGIIPDIAAKRAAKHVRVGCLALSLRTRA